MFKVKRLEPLFLQREFIPFFLQPTALLLENLVLSPQNAESKTLKNAANNSISYV